MKYLKLFLLLILSLLFINEMHGQKKNKKFTVSGYVMDTGENPVPGAMILIDKINTGKVTDNKGFYKIKVKPDADTITVFTLYGAIAETYIGGRTSINFLIKEISPLQSIIQNNEGADEVVEIGYGVAKEKNLTQKVNKIDATESNYSSYTNIYDMLRGAVPGVQVSGKRIIIRGMGTINANTDPLFVVDGIVTESIDNIQPNIVKSIQVLKDASASIYGVRGANGVILINTIQAGDR